MTPNQFSPRNGLNKIVQVNAAAGNRGLQKQQASTRVIYDSLLQNASGFYRFFDNVASRTFPQTNLSENKLQVNESMVIKWINFHTFTIATGTTPVTAVAQFSATPALIGSNVPINTATTINYISACPLAYKAAVALTPTATNFPSQFIFQTDAITNGQSFIGTTTYSPAAGYYVKGIALETVSAGGICKVGTKGQFALGAGYPSATAYFDYVGTATSGINIIKGNSGSVTTTNVTLQGLK